MLGKSVAKPILLVIALLAVVAVVSWSQRSSSPTTEQRPFASQSVPEARAAVYVMTAAGDEAEVVRESTRPRLTAGSPTRTVQIPPSNSHDRIPELLGLVEAGSYRAAEELYLYAQRCAPYMPVPRTAAQLEEDTDRIEQVREGRHGPILGTQDEAIEDARRVHELCQNLADNGIHDHLFWLERAAILGSTWAQRAYFLEHYRVFEAGLTEDVLTEELRRIKVNGAVFLEEARGAGDVDAFFAIGASLAGRIPSPFERVDYMRALAHFYAGERAYSALVIQREESGFYEGNVSARRFDLARVENLRRHADELENIVAYYQIEEARQYSDELLRCCI